MYRTLRQLERTGLVSSFWDTSESGPARRMYSLTKAGDLFLSSWIDVLGRYQAVLQKTIEGLEPGRRERRRRDGGAAAERAGLTGRQEAGSKEHDDGREHHRPQNPLDTWRQFITDSERQWNGFFKEVLGTDTISSAMNTWVEGALTVQRMVADQLERYYSTFNIPTHQDLVALGERMKAIEDTLARIESQIGDRRGERRRRAAKARPKPARTKRPPTAA